MPYETKWESLPNDKWGLYKRFHGHVTASEFYEANTSHHNDPRFEDLHYTINDYTDVESHSVSASEVNIAAAHTIGAGQINDRIRIAIISTDSDILALVSKFARFLLIRNPLAVFNELTEARDWAHPNKPR